MENGQIKEAITLAAQGQDLSYSLAMAAMDEIMSGQASEIQMAAYLTALAAKGETITEITASAAGMRKHCVKVLNDSDSLEIVGTGGDYAGSFNISTTSAIVAAAAGIPVAKHGNRAASSKCGAADVLEALGVKIDIPAEHSAELLAKINLCFLFAQNYHLSMKYVAPVRKELGIRTIFNILGPLTNPAGAKTQLLGVYDESLCEPLAKVLSNLGVEHALVVYGQDGLDEISASSPTTVCEMRRGFIRTYEITPEQFGFERCDKVDLEGGSPAENAAITRAILSGEERGGKLTAVLLNAGAAIFIARQELSMEEAIAVAREAIESGAAGEKLSEFVRESNG